MKTLLQIGSSCNYGAPGKIAEQIGVLAQNNGWDVYMAHGNKYQNPSRLKTFQTVTPFQEHLHELKSFLFDAHGLASTRETKRLVDYIKKINPDVFHLHNIHGYFLNYQVLFEYLITTDIKMIWTLHDCWPFTGHCSHFDFIGCDRWKTGCHHCPGLAVYPKSLCLDRSKENYVLKKRLFTSVADRLTLVPVSDWIAGFVKESFLSKASVKTIHNGIDVEAFSLQESNDLKSDLGIRDEMVILGVASPWIERKGLNDWIRLCKLLPSDKYKLVMVGLSDKQKASMPMEIIGCGRVNSARELAKYYSMADVFLNTTYEDNFPTVNLEAMACGTPVITYKTGGSPEAVTSETGWVVEQGDLTNVSAILEEFTLKYSAERLSQRMACRERAVQEFDKDRCFKKYIQLYNKLTR